MSALGQKRTCAAQKAMSALHLIATVKADIALQDACSSTRHRGNLRAVQLLLGHTKTESAVRSLGIDVGDDLAIAEQVDV